MAFTTRRKKLFTAKEVLESHLEGQVPPKRAGSNGSCIVVGYSFFQTPSIDNRNFVEKQKYKLFQVASDSFKLQHDKT